MEEKYANVAVVGATFAYFSVSLNGSTSETTVTATTGKVPTITLTNNSTALYLHATATDMIKGIYIGVKMKKHKLIFKTKKIILKIIFIKR